MKISVKIHIFHTRQILIEPKLLGHVSKTPLHICRFIRYRNAKYGKDSLSWKHQPADHSKECRLPRAVWPDKCCHLPPHRPYIQTVHSSQKFSPAGIPEPFRHTGRFHHISVSHDTSFPGI